MNSKFNKISVIGAGYVGLITGACLSKYNNSVILVEKNILKIKQINNGKDPINEPNLRKIIKTSLQKKSLKATKDLNNAILNTDITFIAVDTPSKKKGIDLRQIKFVINKISIALLKKFKRANSEHYIIIKSTVLPGTTNYLFQILKEKLGTYIKNVKIGSNPEFLRQGYAVNDFLYPDRIVIGTNNKKAENKIKEIYKNFKCPIISTSIENSELIKYVSNTFLANLISFSNEISKVCMKIDNTDVQTIFKALHLDKRLFVKHRNKRIKPKILEYLISGSGYGGSCLPKDVKALNFFLKQKKIKTPLLKSIETINDQQPQKVIKHFENKIGSIKNMKIAVLGVSFKGDSDDLRDSPAIKIINLLKKKGGKINAWDPVVKREKIKNLMIKKFSNNLINIVSKTDCIFIATSIKRINYFNWKKISKVVSKKTIYDSRNLLDKKKVEKYFNYYHIGC